MEQLQLTIDLIFILHAAQIKVQNIISTVVQLQFSS